MDNNNSNIEWLGVSIKQLHDILIDKYGYSNKAADGAIIKIIKISNVLRPHLYEYINHDSIDWNLKLGEWSINRLVCEMKMKPIGAFLTIDWLIRSPEEANKALNRGYDRAVKK